MTTPRLLCSVNFRPRNDCAAVTPRQRMISGETAESSASTQGRQASTSWYAGFEWMRRLPRGSHLKCLTAFVTYTSERSIPARARASSRTCPAGPAKGRPARSSWSPGCSPTTKSRLVRFPSPKTVCVALAYSGHPRHPRAASASGARSRVAGTNGAAPPSARSLIASTCDRAPATRPAIPAVSGSPAQRFCGISVRIDVRFKRAGLKMAS